MFFVRKDNIGSPLGTQKEFAAAQRRGIEFVADRSAVPQNSVWHYLWPIDLVEPGIRNSLQAPRADAVVGDEQREPTHVIWSQEVTLRDTVGDPVITGWIAPEFSYNAPVTTWLDKARQAWQAAHAGAPAQLAAPQP